MYAMTILITFQQVILNVFSTDGAANGDEDDATNGDEDDATDGDLHDDDDGDADDSIDISYMVTSELIDAIGAALQPGGLLLLQSNVEDVAVHARTVAEQRGFCAMEDEGDASLSVGGTEIRGAGVAGSAVPGERRRARLTQVYGEAIPRAVGSGWLSANPLGEHSRSHPKQTPNLQADDALRVCTRRRGAVRDGSDARAQGADHLPLSALQRPKGW